jgi:uncharacterized delta-60 repeat protein
VRFAYVALIGIVGCQAILGFEDVTLRGDTSGAAGSTASGGSGGTANFTIALEATPPVARVVRGASTEIVVNVTRMGFDGPVTVRLDALPSGVTSDEATVAGGESQTTLIINASAQATLGHAALQLVDADMLAAPVEVLLLVADPPGTLDETFDADGVALIAPNGANGAVARRAVVQPDDAIVVGGSGTGAPWALVRLLPDGSPDATFNQNVLAALPADGALRSVAFDVTESKVIACGQSNSQMTVLRLNLDGTADQAFGANGIVRTSQITFSQGSECHAVIAQPDSRILAAGFSTEPGTPRGLVARFMTDGMPDTSFVGGYVTDVQMTRYYGVALDGDRILVSGGNTSTIPEFHARRLEATGVQDPSYASGGSITFTGGVVYPADATREADGRLTLCGTDDGGVPRAAVGALDAAGALVWPPDSKKMFGIHGNNDRFYGCAAQTGGYVLAAGFGYGAESHETYVARITPAGDLDMAFGDMGATRFLYEMTQVTRSLYGVTLQPDGRIVAVGGQVNAGFAVVRIWD